METLTRESLRIVHVDDDGDFAFLSQRKLQRAGFKNPIVRCEDGALAIEYFSTIDLESKPHVIILDLNMPRVNGLEVLLWLRRTYGKGDVAIYLLTSSNDPEHLKQAARAGVTKYMIKSASLDELIQTLDHFIADRNSGGRSVLNLPGRDPTSSD
jgi:CheY-like chemotaxis protein